MEGGENSVLIRVQGGGIIEEEAWLGELIPEIRGLEGTLLRVTSPRGSLVPTCFRGYAPTVATAEPPCVEQVEPLFSAGFIHEENASYFTGHKICVKLQVRHGEEILIMRF